MNVFPEGGLALSNATRYSVNYRWMRWLIRYYPVYTSEFTGIRCAQRCQATEGGISASSVFISKVLIGKHCPRDVKTLVADGKLQTVCNRKCSRGGRAPVTKPFRVAGSSFGGQSLMKSGDRRKDCA